MFGINPAIRPLTDPEGYEAMMKKIEANRYKQKLLHDKRQKALYEGNE
jgi:hypothetical protein